MGTEKVISFFPTFSDKNKYSNSKSGESHPAGARLRDKYSNSKSGELHSFALIHFGGFERNHKKNIFTIFKKKVKIT
jgi:hypothetical protein